MVDVTKGIFKCDRDTMLYLLMKGYGKYYNIILLLLVFLVWH